MVQRVETVVDTATLRQADDREATTLTNKRQLLVALMLPQAMVVTNLAVMSVALPAIRETFNAPIDLMAWVITIYTLPYVALMPLYGRLGDSLGSRRMLLVSAVVFLAGTTLNALSQSLPLLLLGRFVQGAGASGVVPLAIATISRVFPEATRGRALGQWNSIGPVASVAGSLLAGIIIDNLGWPVIFLLPLLTGGAAIAMVYRAARTPEPTPQLRALRGFDWGGVLLLSAMLAAFLFYITSRSITGRPPLSDWRLLLASIALSATFVWHERRRATPFIDLSLLSDTNLLKTCLCSATRMFVMSSTAFLIPLFLADLAGLSATTTGLIIMIRAAALFPTMYFGGRIADAWGSRRPILLGLGIQTASLVLLGLAGGNGSGAWVAVGLLVNGLSAGLALPALHRAATEGLDEKRGGAAAGVYSMIRFWGMMLGTAVAGVLLQSLLDRGTSPLTSYRLVYAATAIVGAIGVITAATLREDQ
jgi:MFS family permease